MLEHIHSPEDLSSLSIHELNKLARLMRERVIEVLATNPCGGHLSSNLGIVELTIALHKHFKAPFDKFIFDTSHQTYIHKILTGRNDKMPTIRQKDGLCGFSCPTESPYDHFYAGHAGTALSLALGMAKSRDLLGDKNFIIPILGDAALTCGLTLEALNNIPHDLRNFPIILNDNNMSISASVGCFSKILSKGTSVEKRREFFSCFGLDYVGPLDGHNIEEILKTFQKHKNLSKPTIFHFLTVKGQGMDHAMNAPTTYHGVKPFNLDTGKFLTHLKANPKFPQIFGKFLVELALKNPNIIAITPAMPAGSCLNAFMQKFPDRCIDVGIAEGHSITYAGGVAAEKKQKVFVAIYATFLQRALDNLFQDVCLQELPVTFAIDRGGIAGPDGATHNGIYEIGFLVSMPNMIVAQPRNGELLKQLMQSSINWAQPTAIRYPNLPTTETNLPHQDRVIGKGEIIHSGEDIAIIALGHKIQDAIEVKDRLSQYGYNPTIIDPIFLKPLDSELIKSIALTHRYIFTIEEHCISSGLGNIINSFIMQERLDICVYNFGIKDAFIHHGSHKDISQELGLDAASISQEILKQVPLEARV